VLTLAYSGEDEGSSINDAETVLVGRDVVSINRTEPPARTLLSPSAAMLALIARVQTAQTHRREHLLATPGSPAGQDIDPGRQA
jgi:hypothetical protein